MKTAEHSEAGWREHEEQQRLRWLRLTHLEKLRWLDGAKRFVAMAEKSGKPPETAPRERGR